MRGIPDLIGRATSRDDVRTMVPRSRVVRGQGHYPEDAGGLVLKVNRLIDV